MINYIRRKLIYRPSTRKWTLDAHTDYNAIHRMMQKERREGYLDGWQHAKLNMKFNPPKNPEGGKS